MQSNFEYVRNLIFDEAGIVLDAGKTYLLESRLGPVARAERLPSIDDLVDLLRTQQPRALRGKVVDALTTNETTFFRDVEPFHLLRTTILPALIEARQRSRRLRIWYAACSTGQEPYSVAMLLDDEFPQLAGWQIEHRATDISRAALDRAIAGVYSVGEISRGLPSRLRDKYFRQSGMEYQIADRLRAAVRFEPMNLNGVWPSSHPWDIIFVRNVMIYFDVQARKRILGRVHELLAPDGYLLLGATETTLGLDERYQRLPGARGSCYQRAAARS